MWKEKPGKGEGGRGGMAGASQAGMLELHFQTGQSGSGCSERTAEPRSKKVEQGGT